MEAQKVKETVGRTFRWVRSLFDSLPSIPSNGPAAESEGRSANQQWSPGEDEQTEFHEVTLENQAPSNAENLREPDSTSNSTDRITNVDSFGFENLQASSSISHPSVLIPSLKKASGAIVFDRNFLVDPHAEMDPEKSRLWKEDIEDRLSNALEQKGKGVLGADFMMAGRSKKRLKPTIVITCENETSQKHTIKILKTFYWLKPHRLNYRIVLNSEKKEVEPFAKALTGSNAKNLTVKANLGSEPNTLCGIAAGISEPHLQSDTSFRLGGLLLVRGQVFSLTIGHVLWPKSHDNLSLNSGEADGFEDDDATESEDMSFIFMKGDCASDFDTESEDDNLELEDDAFETACNAHKDHSESTFRTSISDRSNWTEIGNFQESTTLGPIPEATKSPLCSDWALVSVVNRELWLDNVVQIPGNSGLTLIEDTISEDQIIPGQVWAVTDSSHPQPGLLSACSSFLFLHRKRLRVRQITFEQALVPGDSGAWVIQDGKLCGHIVAGRKGLRWAYMVLIQDIFDELKGCFKTTEVCVLTASMAKALRNQPSTKRIRQPPNSSSRRAGGTDASPPAMDDVSDPITNRDCEERGSKGKSLSKLSHKPKPSIAPGQILHHPDDSTSVPRISQESTLQAYGSTSQPPFEQTESEARSEAREDGGRRGGLRQNLRWWQILMIAISGVIGSNMYANDGKTLEVAGPGGALISFAIVGIIAIAVMECVSEMVQLFPTPNAMVEYVKVFVDADLAWIIGVAYWYTYSSTFILLCITASQFSTYWGLAQLWQVVAFYISAPLVILAINVQGVKRFGIIVAIGGLLKLCIVFGCMTLMYAIFSEKVHGAIFIGEGFKHNPSVAKDPISAICYAIPFTAYGFLGVELVIVVVSEARDSKALVGPSKIIAYMTALLYFALTLGEYLNIGWTDLRLPMIYSKGNEGGNGSTRSTHQSTALVVLVAQKYGYRMLPGFLTGCMIFSILNTSNTALYIASRALYGVAREISPKRGPMSWISRPGTVNPSTGVPSWALVVSALSFLWLPFVYLRKDVAAQDLVEILTLAGTVSCLLVWASLCLAYIRYYHWFRMQTTEGRLEGTYCRFNRTSSSWQARTLLGFYQPLLAYVGLIGCLLMVFVCTSALWWESDATITKIMAAYASPIVVLVFWSGRKIYWYWRCRKSGILPGRPFVRLDPNFPELAKVLDRLTGLKDRQSTREVPLV